MKKLLCVIFALLLCAGACAEAGEFILPMGLPFGATVEEVTAIDPEVTAYEMGGQVTYVGYAPAQALGHDIASHNYHFDADGGLMSYVSGIQPENFASFEEDLKANYGELIHVSANGDMLDYKTITGALYDGHWTTVEDISAAYAESGMNITVLSQYLAKTDAGYVGIIVEGISMSDGEVCYETCACYFTLLDAAACEILGSDPKIAG